MGIDAFDVVGTLTTSPDIPPRYEQNDANFSYGGPWATATQTQASGGNLTVLNSLGSATATFTGTYLSLIGKTGPSYGKAKVTLDGVTTTMIDLYRPADAHKQSVYNTGILPLGPHTVTVEWTGTKNGAASNYNVGVDAFDVLGTVTLAPPAPAFPTRYQQSDAFITMLGMWSYAGTSSASGGSYVYTGTAGTRATVTFNGTGLSWLATTGNNYGIARVSLDGGPLQYVDFYTAGTEYLKEVYDTGALAARRPYAGDRARWHQECGFFRIPDRHGCVRHIRDAHRCTEPDAISAD